MEYYHNLTTQKSFDLLKHLRLKFNFVLIGGWAVFMHTKSLKSKDIDLIVDFSELEKLRQVYHLTKNDRLKKYEIKSEEIDVDLYVYHYSNPGLPAEEAAKFAVPHEGFLIPRPEVLLILKQQAHESRVGTTKGEKDRIDIFALLQLPDFDLEFYRNTLGQYNRAEFLSLLKRLISETMEVKELNLDRHKFSRFKKKILGELEK